MKTTPRRMTSLCRNGSQLFQGRHERYLANNGFRKKPTLFGKKAPTPTGGAGGCVTSQGSRSNPGQLRPRQTRWIVCYGPALSIAWDVSVFFYLQGLLLLEYGGPTCSYTGAGGGIRNLPTCRPYTYRTTDLRSTTLYLHNSWDGFRDPG